MKLLVLVGTVALVWGRGARGVATIDPNSVWGVKISASLYCSPDNCDVPPHAFMLYNESADDGAGKFSDPAVPSCVKLNTGTYRLATAYVLSGKPDIGTFSSTFSVDVNQVLTIKTEYDHGGQQYGHAIPDATVKVNGSVLMNQRDDAKYWAQNVTFHGLC
jgi:hypothetical protein